MGFAPPANCRESIVNSREMYQGVRWVINITCGSLFYLLLESINTVAYSFTVMVISSSESDVVGTQTDRLFTLCWRTFHVPVTSCLQHFASCVVCGFQLQISTYWLVLMRDCTRSISMRSMKIQWNWWVELSCFSPKSPSVFLYCRNI